MKLKTVYVCSTCAATHPKWAGQCGNCHAWNSLIEDVIDVSPAKKLTVKVPSKAPISITAAHADTGSRAETGIGEFDRVLGGGFMPDQLVLLTGDPGVGKSTLTLQIADCMAALGQKILYFSGEESTGQIAGRARRLGLTGDIGLINTTHLESVLATIESEKPDFVVIDSVQVMASELLGNAAGTITQIRHVAEQMMQVAKGRQIPILLIGHVTKDGVLAGPQSLTHLVDTVLYLEGDRYHNYRLLRSTKNRFGAVDEVGVFAMEEGGMNEVKNPSALFLEGRASNPIGSVIVPIIEGTRAFLVEVQALTQYTQFGYPKRTADGFELNRLNIIIAVLNRYANLKLDSCDVFVNVVGGLKLTEPAADLAVALAIASSKMQKPLPPTLAAMGEVGLSGEVRMVSHLERRLKEAKKLGFTNTLSPKDVTQITQAVFGVLKSDD